MIIFLTLCYCGVLAALIHFKVIRLTLWWKLSPLLWMVVLLIVLFLPMQWGAPSGAVTTYQTVIEIIPNVSGEVIEVPVDGLSEIQEGDLLFRIDPTPFQARVDQASAQLVDAKQKVEQLKESLAAANATVTKTEADIELAKADQRSAAANLDSLRARRKETQALESKARAVRDDFKVQVAAGTREFERVKALVARKAAPLSDQDVAEVQMQSLQSKLTAAEADVVVASDAILRAEADVTGAEVAQQSANLRLSQLVESELPRVKALAKEADLAANSSVNGKHTLIAAAEAVLAQAAYDLDQTEIRAPTNGYLIGMTLRPGQRVTTFPVRAWMTFVTAEEPTVAVGVPQYTTRHVKEGQKAEITFRSRPGVVYSATVNGIGRITAEGQVQPSGVVVEAPTTSQPVMPFGVRLTLDDEEAAKSLPGGAVGTAAIYTESMKATHIIRRVMLRMEAWMNYINPW